MGLLGRMLETLRFRVDSGQPVARPNFSKKPHVCHFETLEPRCMLAADIHFGSVYFEEATGDDSSGDTIEITFEGGAAGTELTHVVIDGDKLIDGEVTLGDIFFDLEEGGLGAFNAVGLDLQTPVGFTVENITFGDGIGSGDGDYLLAFDLSGFTAGDKLIFSVDVDEQGLFNSTALAEGGEFEGTRLTGFFSAEHYYDTDGTAIYFDAFDPKFNTTAADTGTTLDLPTDDYMPPDQQDRSDRTAGAVLSLAQTPEPITIAGTVFEDMNRNNFQDAEDPGLANVDVTLLRFEDGIFVSVGDPIQTDGDGDYLFEGPELTPGIYRVVETQPGGFFSVGAAAGTVDGVTVGTVETVDIITGVSLLGGQDSIDNDFAETKPAELHGIVYHDRDNDGVREAGEEGIPGATVVLYAAGESTPYMAPSVTNALGEWSFLGLAPGEYRVVEIQPEPYLDGFDVPGDAGGTAINPGDEINGIVLAGAQIGRFYQFGEYLPGSIRGRVHADVDGDCIVDEGEEFIEGVLIELLNEAGEVIDTTTTDENGEYLFENLDPGTYGVHEIQPVEYLDGSEHVGTGSSTNPGIVESNDLLTEIEINSGENLIDYNFCEHVPLTLSGWVYHDRDNDGLREPGQNEEGIGGVTLVLLDGDGEPTGKTAVTSSDPSSLGFYEFDGLAPGKYRVIEQHPEGWIDGLDTPGTVGGVANNPGDSIHEIMLSFGNTAEHYNFGELLPGSIRGTVHVDTDGDCLRDPEEPRLEGVQVDLLNEAGDVIDTTLTDVNGEYHFDNLAPGTYGVFEHQPEGYFHGGQDVGTGSSTNVGIVATDDLLTLIEVNSAENLVNYDFCEIPPGSIRGTVHVDTDGDCLIDEDELRLEGVQVDLLNQAGEVIATTYTDSNGEYLFDDLAPGTYGVFEHQPEGYFHGDQHVGTGSSTDGGVIAGDDWVADIEINGGNQLVNYDFCEVPPGSIQGTVHVDTDGDCLIDEDELRLEGVQVDLLNQAGEVIATTYTDSNGEYLFDDLAPGTYGVFEHQPEGYFHGDQHVGTGSSTDGGVVAGDDWVADIEINGGNQLVNYDFCEVPPGSISGIVHVDTDGDCFEDEGEPRLEGIEVQLLNESGEVIATTTTNANGEYRFDNLAPGTYGVHEIQPEEYFHGYQHVGSGSLTSDGSIGGDDLLVDLEISWGEDLVHYNFCEVPPASISGYVFQDGDVIRTSDGLPPEDITTVRDGQFTSDDSPISGVTLELRHGVTGVALDPSTAMPGVYSGSTITTVTDANGFYKFTGLRAGNYSVYEVQPENYHDSLDTAGTLGGVAINPSDAGIFSVMTLLQSDPKDDAIVRIALFAGQDSQQNNFSEVLADKVIPWVPEDNPRATPPPNPVAPPALPYEPLDVITPERPFVQDLYGGSGEMIWYTWHLSVVNAGRPRAVTPLSHDPRGDSAMIFHNTSFNIAGFNQSRWMIEDTEGREWNPLFGNPDAIPVTGDFNGDGVSEIGVYIDGEWFIDVNGNGRWDDEDLWAKLGTETDKPVTGDWDGDGKDDIGIFGPAWAGDPRAVAAEPGLPEAHNVTTGKHKNLPPEQQDATLGDRRLQLTADGRVREDVIDHVFNYGSPIDEPLTGDWDGDGIATIAIFRDGAWYFDVDGDGRWSKADRATNFGTAGDRAVVGDWNGDGVDNIGIYRGGKWILDSDGNGRLEGTDKVFEMGGKDDKPITGDWNGDGLDQPGIFQATRPERVGSLPGAAPLGE